MHAEKTIIILVIALVVTNIAWWIRVRGLNGVISDLKNIPSDAKNVQASAASVANKVTGK